MAADDPNEYEGRPIPKSTESSASKSILRAGHPNRLNAKQLAKAIFDAELPEGYVKQLPAQSLFMAIQTIGLASSVDILRLITPEQQQLLFDFDFWDKDRFNEDRFWNWLEITDEDEDLILLQNFLRVLDLKLIGILIERYTHTIIMEHPSEAPPAPKYFTPDKGSTWTAINIDDADRHRLFARLLALIFETNPDLYYQVMSIPNVSTPSILEEESFQEKSRRLRDEGVPELDTAHEVHAPIDVERLTQDIKSARVVRTRPTLELSITPIVYQSGTVEPLASTITRMASEASHEELSDFESELTHITNSAFVYFGINFSDWDRAVEFTRLVRGALNIGLETLMQQTNHDGISIFRSVGLKPIYRVGMTALKAYNNLAMKVSKTDLEKLVHEPAIFSIIACAREIPPQLPLFLNCDGSYETLDGKLLQGHKSFDHVLELELCSKIISSTQALA